MMDDKFNDKEGFQGSRHLLAYGIVIFFSLSLSVYFSARYFLLSSKPCEITLDCTINPNIASVESIERLPGIGPAKADAIVAFRNQADSQEPKKRAFEKPEDLEQIKGIGPVTVEKLKPFLRFD
jgi:competence ComEA-like helix-hairpin-helix protein